MQTSTQVTQLSESRHKIQFTLSTEQREKLERVRALMRHRNVDGDIAAIVFESGLDRTLERLEKQKFASSKRRKRSDATADSRSGVREERTEAMDSETVAKRARPAVEATEASRTPAGATTERQRHQASEVTMNPATEKARATELPLPVVPRPPAQPPTPTPAATKGGADSSDKRGRITAAARREVAMRDGERCSFVGSNGDRCGSRDLLEIDHVHPRALGGDSEPTNLRLLCRAHNRHAAERIFGREHVARAIEASQRKRAAKSPADSARRQAKPAMRD